GGGGSLIWLT
ncbi:hypothetical protein VCEDC022_001270B, partial [Vibrio cholerae O1 str. EDC-022]